MEELKLRAGNPAKRPGKKHPFWVGVWTLTKKDKDGNIIAQEVIENALADEGENQILDIYLRGATAPTGFFFRLYNDTPVETDTLADLLNEPSSANGYAAQTVERSSVGWPTFALDAGDWMATSKTVTFSATNSGWTATYAVLATSSDNLGKLIAFVALSQTRTLAAGETLDVSMSVKLQ